MEHVFDELKLCSICCIVILPIRQWLLEITYDVEHVFDELKLCSICCIVILPIRQ